MRLGQLGLGFKASGSGFRVQGFVFRDEGLEFRACGITMQYGKWRKLAPFKIPVYYIQMMYIGW